MNKHLDKRMQAYFDGELDAKSQAEVEMHLDECKDCLEKMANFASLSALLQEENEITNNKAEQFVSAVIMRLPVEKKVLWWKGLGKMAYTLIPALLFITMLFIKTTTVTNLLLTGAETVGFGGKAITSLIAEPLFKTPANPIDLSRVELFDTGILIWNSLGSINLFGIDLINTFVLPLILGLLAVSWTIGWWVDQEKKQSVQLKI